LAAAVETTMRCVLCRACLEAYRQRQEKLQAWRWAQANDREIWAREADLMAVRVIVDLQQGDPAAAFPQLAALAEQGSVWSMLLVGCAYENGTGIELDEGLAEHWYLRAAEGGCQRAVLYLGALYARRDDLAGQQRAYLLDAARNWAPAQHYLAWTKLRKPRSRAMLMEARGLFEQAAAAGDLGSELQLGILTARGAFGWHRIPAGVRWVWRVVGKMDLAGEQPATSEQTRAAPTPSSALVPAA
jgi:TPR repeat protein